MLEKVEAVIKFFPLIFVLLTTFGYVHLQCYYYFFDIEILNYLDLFEIILLFFNTSILLIAGILIVIALSFALDFKISNEADFVTEESKKKTQSKMQSYINLLALCVAVLLLAKIGFDLIFGHYIGIIFPIGFIICGIIFFVFEKYILKILFYNNRNPFFFFSVGISFGALLLIILMSVTSSIQKGYDVRYNYLTLKQVCFSYNDKIIKTSKYVKYIGETKKNLFLFDSKKNETIIFKMENIDNLRIKHGK